MARISKKTYAALMCAKDDTREIIKLREAMNANPVNTLVEDILELCANLKVTNAYKTCQAIAELAGKYQCCEANAHATAEAMANHAARWLADFEDVNPLWKPTPTVVEGIETETK